MSPPMAPLFLGVWASPTSTRTLLSMSPACCISNIFFFLSKSCRLSNSEKAMFKIPFAAPPELQEPEEWSEDMHDFVKKCLCKEVKERPTAEELLQVKLLSSF